LFERHPSAGHFPTLYLGLYRKGKGELEEDMKAQRGVEVSHYYFLNLDARWVGGQRHALSALTSGKDPVPIVVEAGWASEPVWTGAGNLAPPEFDPSAVNPVASRYTEQAIPTNGTIQYILY
jgi:hypothetical protein